MPYAEIVFSRPQQLAVLGHAIQSRKFLQLALTSNVNARWFTEAPMAGGIWDALVEFHKQHHRCPTIAELESTAMFVKEDPQAIASAKKWLADALEASRSIGADTLRPALGEWVEAWTMRNGVEAMMQVWNNGDMAAAKKGLFETADAVRKADPSQLSRQADEGLDAGLDRRKKSTGQLLMTGLTFIDEPTGGLRADDLMIVSSYTGFGKTQLMTTLAWNFAKAGKKVKLFALEAGDSEIEMRILFQDMARRRYEAGQRTPVEYGNWVRGEHPECARWEHPDALKPYLKNLSITYKKTSRYGIDELERDIVSVREDLGGVDVVLVDHLHYIDQAARKTETEGLRDTMKRIRDVNLAIERPIVLAAHIKKQQEAKRFQTLLPSIDDIYGSGDVTKLATWVLTLAQPLQLDPDRFPFEQLRDQGAGYPTLVRFLKSRDFGVSRTAYTLVPFFARGTYQEQYTIGRTEKADTKWSAVAPTVAPWAKSAFPYAAVSGTLPAAA
jgi:hypothetical protein